MQGFGALKKGGAGTEGAGSVGWVFPRQQGSSMFPAAEGRVFSTS